MLYHCFAASFNMESEVKTEQQETKIIRKNERYPHQHQQQKVSLLNEHSFFHDSAKISSSEISTSSSNLILGITEIAKNKPGQQYCNYDAEVENKLNMEELSVSSIVPEDHIKDLHNLTNENMPGTFQTDNMINGHCENHCSDENEGNVAQDVLQEVNHYKSGFRIDHFAECLAEDVLEDSLLEAKAEIDSQVDQISCVNQPQEKITPIKDDNIENKEDCYTQVVTKNNSTTLNSTKGLCLAVTLNSIAEESNPKASDSRVHSKSLCLNDSNAYTEICSNFITTSQLQPNSSCPQIDENIKELTEIQQLVQNFPSEDIIPFDQDDECCSNSVVDGLDKLLSDDDIEDDIENLGSVITNKLSCTDISTKPLHEEATYGLEGAPPNEYNLFDAVEPPQNQTISSNHYPSNSCLDDFSSLNRLSSPSDQVSNKWQIPQNLCDNSNNVIHNPEVFASLSPNQQQHEYENILIPTIDTNIDHSIKTHMNNPEDQVLSNISSLLQYLPEQVEKLATEFNGNAEVCITFIFHFCSDMP